MTNDFPRLSAFADEIDPDLDEQIRVCRETGVTHLELRSVDKVNVLDLTEAARRTIRQKLADADMGVAAIGSPVGKVAIDGPWAEHFDRFKVAADAAAFFDTPFIRLFSYYPPGGEGKGPVGPMRDEVIDRFRQKVEYLQGSPTVMVHENEKGIYGDTGPRCLDLMQSVDSPKLRTAFDFANFVQVGDDPAADWPMLKAYTVHFHIKDAVAGSGKVVPAGEGDGKVGEILAEAWASGYRGFLSLEPHLMVAGHSGGETGPVLFRTAVDALRKVCRERNVPLA